MDIAQVGIFVLVNRINVGVVRRVMGVLSAALCIGTRIRIWILKNMLKRGDGCCEDRDWETYS